MPPHEMMEVVDVTQDDAELSRSATSKGWRLSASHDQQQGFFAQGTGIPGFFAQPSRLPKATASPQGPQKDEQGHLHLRRMLDEERATTIQEQTLLQKTLEVEHLQKIHQLLDEHAAASVGTAQDKGIDELFHFSVRGGNADQLSGCVPRKIFDAEPDSALTALVRLFPGKDSFATDAKDKAIVNSNPAHWPIILDWLSFGTVPQDPPAGLRDECKHWELGHLLAALLLAEAQQRQGNAPEKSSSKNFQATREVVGSSLVLKAQVYLENFSRRLAALDASGSQKLQIPIQLAGRDCMLEIGKFSYRTGPQQVEAGLWRSSIRITEGRPVNITHAKSVWGSHATKIVKEEERGGYLPNQMSCSIPWAEMDNDKMMHPSMVTADGTMLVEISLELEA